MQHPFNPWASCFLLSTTSWPSCQICCTQLYITAFLLMIWSYYLDRSTLCLWCDRDNFLDAGCHSIQKDTQGDEVYNSAFYGHELSEVVFFSFRIHPLAKCLFIFRVCVGFQTALSSHRRPKTFEVTLNCLWVRVFQPVYLGWPGDEVVICRTLYLTSFTLILENG